MTKKKIKDLTLQEINDICKKQEKCRDCPFFSEEFYRWGGYKCVFDIYRPRHWDWTINNDFPWEKEIEV